MSHLIKRLYLWGIIAYIILVALAIVFYLERTVFIDVAFIFFQILKNNALAIQAFRFGSGITQSIILFTGRLGFSLQNVALAYSAGVMVYYFICYLLCGLAFKNYRMGLVLLLAQALFVADSFFWIQAELAQGIPFLLVTIAWITRPGNHKTTLAEYPLLLAAFVTATFFHPLIFILAFYLIIFFWMRRSEANRKMLLYMAVIVIATVVVKNVFFKAPYDTGMTDSARDSIKMLHEFFSFPSTRKFIKNCLYKYYWIPIRGILVFTHYLKAKRYRELSFFAVSLGGYLVLINTCFRDAATFYIENLYLPMGVILAVPLVYDVLPAMQGKRVPTQALVALVLITLFIRIGYTSPPYTKRLKWEESFLSKHREGKWIYGANNVPMDVLIMNWCTPYEFWLLSTIKYGETASIIIADDVEKFREIGRSRLEFVGTYDFVSYDQLPARYFNFPDTLSHYSVVK